jgi:hypothetical protein
MARLEIDFLTEHDDASLLAKLQRIAKATDSGTVTRADIRSMRSLKSMKRWEGLKSNQVDGSSYIHIRDKFDV